MTHPAPPATAFSTRDNTVAKHFVIFCQVVDNFGDIGVCWRLAKQLRQELGQTVTLWVDALASLQALCPEINPQQQRQQLLGVTICYWGKATFNERQHIAFNAQTVVIEAFGCTLPAAVIAQIKAQRCQWVNLEYLALEHWADDVHLASSPVHGCHKTFFVPGFSARTGGLLMDAELRALTSTPTVIARQELHALLGDLEQFAKHRWVSIFSYANAPVAWLLKALATSEQPTLCLVSAGLATEAFEQALNAKLEVGKAHTHGQVTLLAMPFLPQPAFDQVLAASDLNIVRGEESAARAQLLGKPFLWQLYPQTANAHHEKLAAFLANFLNDCPRELADPLAELFWLWNGVGTPSENAALPPLLASPPATTLVPWQAHCALWQKTLIKHGSLANNLFHFCTGCV